MIDELIESIGDARRIVIAGGPKSGKTTLARGLSERLELEVRSTDDLISTHEWSEASDTVAGWISSPGDWIIEGVATVRAVRKILGGRDPVEPYVIVYLSGSFAHRTSGQAAMSKGCARVWSEVSPTLRHRGIKMIEPAARSPAASERKPLRSMLSARGMIRNARFGE